MNKILSLLLLLCMVFSLTSCEKNVDAYDLLTEFISTYGAEGIIYSPIVPEGDDGYVRDGLTKRIYLYSGEFPENYAIFFNGHTDFSSECAVFVCTDADTLAMVEEMSLERIRLVASGADHAFVRKSGSICFYSTMKDRARAEKIFSEIIRKF